MTVQEEVRQRIDRDALLAKLRGKISSGKATYDDTAAYSNRAGKLLGEIFSRRLPEIDLSDREALCVELLRERYTDINALCDAVQKALDEAQGLHLKPQHAPFDSERAHQIGGSTADTSKPEEVRHRRAGSATETMTKSMHDDRIKAEAKFRSRAGLDCRITRVAVNGCCPWCSKVAGRYRYGEEPEGIYKRHDNCDCTVTFENGRKRQDVWSKRTWEAPEPGAGAGDAVVLTEAQAAAAGAGELVNFIGKEIPQNDLTILSRNVTIKAEGSAFDAFNRKIGPSDLIEDLNAVNPYFEKGTPYGKNCQRCVPTFVLRRRGYNVTALPASNTQIDDFLMNYPEAVWKKAGRPIIPNHTRGSKYFGKPEIEKFMKGLPDGAMCEIRCQWADEEKGHVFIALKENKKVRYIDPQIGSDEVSYYFSKMKPNKTTFWRIDDATLDENLISYCCK